MTPTLIGRWQTRIALLGTLGAIVTGLFAAVDRGAAATLFLLLLDVALLGLLWDALYSLAQKLRWERDWPPLFAIGGGLAEAALLYLLTRTTGLPGIAAGSVPVGLFLAMYAAVWLTTFAAQQGPLRVLFPRWRFNGGRIAGC